MKRINRFISIFLTITLALGVNVYAPQEVKADVDNSVSYMGPCSEGHDIENDVCNNCGFVMGAQEDVTYKTYTSEDNPFQVIEFTATRDANFTFMCSDSDDIEGTWDAYGYLFDDTAYLESEINDAINRMKTGEDYVRLDNYIEYNDDDGEGNLPAIKYSLSKNKTYYFVVGPYDVEYGEFDVTVSCPHDNTVVQGKTIDNCATGGYTGDVYCFICEKIIKEGTEIAPGSAHGEEILIEDSYVEKTCEEDGYTGDYMCEYCNTITITGEIIEAQGHDEVVDEYSGREADCYTEGIEKLVICSICDEILDEGEAIPKTTHKYENDVCKNCGRIRNAQEGVTYSTSTNESQIFQVIEFTAPATAVYKFDCSGVGEEWDSYGYLYEKSDTLDSIIETALIKYREGEEGASRLYGAIASNDDKGDGSFYPGIIYKLTKGVTYCFVVGPYNTAYGEFNVTIDCAHTNITVVNKNISSCIQGGYSGDVICDGCHKTLESGVTIEPNSAHVYVSEVISEANCKNYEKLKYTCKYCKDSYESFNIEAGYGDCMFIPEGSIEPTCTKAGHTGRFVCVYCGTVDDEGVIIPAYHDEIDENGNNYNFIYNWNMYEATCCKDGYTGDTVCMVCRKVMEQGNVIKAQGHMFEEGVCSTCGLEDDFLAKDSKGVYLIYTADDLVKFIQNAKNGIDAKLMANIIFPDSYACSDWGEAIANSIVLDGNGYTISNFNINGEKLSLFRLVKNSTIKNLTIECNVERTYIESFGAIACEAECSTFNKCTIKGQISVCAYDYGTGGVIGKAIGCTFTDCSNKADLKNEEYNTGGIAGIAYFSNFDNCSNGASIFSGNGIAGGIVGTAEIVSIINSKNSGNIVWSDNGVEKYSYGGIVGEGSYVDITKCTNTGNIGKETSEFTIVGSVGGIVGNLIDKGTITDCTNSGSVNGAERFVGGIAGSAQHTVITGCINNGNVASKECVGGVLGIGVYLNLSNCINNGDVSGNDYVAGIAGTIVGSEVNKVYNMGTVTGDGENVNGLISRDERNKVTNAEGNHKHINNVQTKLTPATLTKDGYIEYKCKCDMVGIKTTTIARIGTVNISKSQYTYNKKNIKLPTVTVKDRTGKTISSSYYTVTYVNKKTGKTVTSIKSKGTYNVKIKFKGNYSGEVTKNITVESNPAKVKIKSKQNVKKKKIKIKWKKVSSVTGYEIKYSTSSKFKKAKTKTIKKNTTKYTLSKLKKKKYYIKMRAYKVVSGNKYVGKWSKTVKVKVKK